jgi:hypothetical protein
MLIGNMNEKTFTWFVEHMPKPTRECPYYRNMLLVMEFYGYGSTTCAEDYE